MAKIVQAVNSMITNEKQISEVTQGRHELFFLYKNKYAWSINALPEEDDCALYYYPGEWTIRELASFENDDWEGVPMVSYRSSEIGTKEGKASFRELAKLIKERLYRVNEVLDDIISDDIPF
jgi:hypothetical protein